MPARSAGIVDSIAAEDGGEGGGATQPRTGGHRSPLRRLPTGQTGRRPERRQGRRRQVRESLEHCARHGQADIRRR